MAIPRVAIACQGGGSHAAFTAGVLGALLSPSLRSRFELVALSGTSGGAVCAALAWAGLITDGPDDAAERLEAFWTDLAADDPFEWWANQVTQWTLRLPFQAEISPYAYATAAEPQLRALLARHMRFDDLPPGEAARSRPLLRLGAARVLQGGGEALPGETLTIADIVASAAVPPLFRAVEARGKLWWDGLYSQNPPVREMLEITPKPDEIWLIRLNPEARAREPISAHDIADRRNEMAGNLPLEHEVYLVRKINRLLAEFPALAARYRPITVRQIALDLPLDYVSKLDRSAAHIARLMARGRERARHLFEASSVLVPATG
jgi:NTE family protein